MPYTPCKDCVTEGVETTRPAPYAGPRCFSHNAKIKRERKAALHEKKVQSTYGLRPGEYAALYESQGGRCAILGCRATGKRKRLAVDHNHKTGEVRGLLCGPHNQLLGYNGDNPDAFRSIADYLVEPPARQVLEPRAWLRVTSDNSEYQEVRDDERVHDYS